VWALAQQQFSVWCTVTSKYQKTCVGLAIVCHCQRLFISMYIQYTNMIIQGATLCSRLLTVTHLMVTV
jgi:hypothetical protein